MTRTEFERALATLVRDAGDVTSRGNLRSDALRSSVACLFSERLSDCYRCTYCADCTFCTGCTHCRDCSHVHASSYCVACERCTESTYLTRCFGCRGCTYCFGCVGLEGKEFHILNVPYPRKQWFEEVARLKEALGM